MADVSQVACACLAAGLSSRMRGDHKLLRHLHGRPVLQQTLGHLESFAFSQKILVLGHEANAIGALAEGTDFSIVMNSNFRSGLHSSIRAAVNACAPQTQALLIILADQPFHLASTLKEFFNRVGVVSERTLARAWHGDKPGHPVLIGRSYFKRVLQEPDGDYGSSYLFKENAFQKAELPDSVLWDLDTPESFEQYANQSLI